VCHANTVHQKTVTLSLSRTLNGPAVVETVATIRSNFGGFGEEAYTVLCQAAFRDYPQPLSGALFEIATK
jgi:hypothetical protein